MSEPSHEAAFLPVADPAYRLPEPARELLRHSLNANALEALLARLRPTPRAELLASFLEMASHGKVAFGPMFSDVIQDPEILRLLADVPGRPMHSPPSPGTGSSTI